MRKIALILLLLPTLCFAQELNCRVQINSDQVQGTNKQVFQTLQESLTEFLNNRKWSQTQLTTTERIDCNFTLVIKEKTEDNNIKGELQVQARRPVYNSSYTTSTLNFKDNNFEFTYQEHDPLLFNNTQIESNLTATIAFYVYMILGIDFDSFSPQGGTPFFEQAMQIVNLSQTSMNVGWRAFENDRNRHALVSAFTEPSTASFRTTWYNYHRQGLDEMALSIEKGRAQVTNSLKELEALSHNSPTTILLPLFKDTKLDEIINIYTKAPQSEKEAIYKELINIYPTDGARLEEIKQRPQN